MARKPANVEMARSPEIVDLPMPGPAAFNKDRPANQLLRMQTVHLRHGLAKHAEKVVRHLAKVTALLAIDIDSIKTEGQVSEYSKSVTGILHPHGGKLHRHAKESK
jgi:hypothetical protein